MALPVPSGGLVIWVSTPTTPSSSPTSSLATRNTASTPFWSRSETKTTNFSPESKQAMSVPSTDTTTRTMVTLFSHSTESPEWTCSWGTLKYRKTETTQEEETKRFHMQLCSLQDLSSPLHSSSAFQKLAPSSPATHSSERNSKTRMVKKFPSLITKFNRKKLFQELQKLLLTFLGLRKSQKLLWKCSMTPSIRASLTDLMKPMQLQVEPKPFWPMKPWEECKFWEEQQADTAS